MPEGELHTLRYFDQEISGAFKKANWKPSEESIAMLVGKGYSEVEIESGLEQYRRGWLPGVELGASIDQDWLSWMLTGRPQASPGSGAQPGCFYAKDGSPQLDAWDAYSRRTKGIGLPRDKKGGWWVDPEWPPDHER